MNPSSKLLLVIGVFVSTATCSGQQPLGRKSMMRFAAEIIRVDSILSTSACYKQRTSNIYLRNMESEKDSIRFELIRDNIKRKRGSICPMIVEIDRPKKI